MSESLSHQIKCTGCGATNTISPGVSGICEFCGIPLPLPQSATQPQPSLATAQAAQMVQVNCPGCGTLNQMPQGVPCNCGACGALLTSPLSGQPVKMLHANCPHCGVLNQFPPGVACNCGSCGQLLASSSPSSQALPARQAAVKPYPNLSDKWAWTLACAPLLIDFIIGFIIGLQGAGDIDDASVLPLIIAVAVNCTLVYQDVKELKRNGLNVNNWLWLGFLLIPVYLFMRAAKTNKKYGYAILWCFLFFVSIL